MQNKQEYHPIRVRFAPSPTGKLHLGGARTALYNFLLAKQSGGKFILRIEDTDRKRLVPGAEEEIYKNLRWLGIDWDEGPNIGGPHGPYRQSERKDIYLKYAHELIDRGQAYYCFCSPDRLNQLRQEQQQQKSVIRYDGLCKSLTHEEINKKIDNGEPYVIRFKTPMDGSTEFLDLIRGEISVDNRLIDDYILVKSDGYALYHLAAIVDDHMMEISHVIRGSEWLPTAPLHALIHRAFGWIEPKWVHLSVFLKPSGKGKMSKREASELIKDGHSIFIDDMHTLGYLPEAVINWIALMGWSYDDHTEYFTLKDLVEKFDLQKLNPSPAAINFTKLDHFNGIHIRSLADNDLVDRLKMVLVRSGISPDEQLLGKIVPIIKERLVVLEDFHDFAGFFFNNSVTPVSEELIGKGMDIPESIKIILEVNNSLKKVTNFITELIEHEMRELVESMGYSPGQVFGIIRVAVTGQKVSPPLFESMEIIGKEKVLERLESAVLQLEQLKSTQ